MRTRINSIIILGFLFVLGCSNSNNTFANGSSEKPDHSEWSTLLTKYVQKDGLVNYKGFVKDSVKLNAYADHLSSNAPADDWTEEEQIAYWINAYNVFTVKLIVDNYPIESIKDLNPTISIPTLRSIWTKEWFQIGGEDFSLDRIEHKILRKDFEEPRIHFAVNCASISCPTLRNEAYTAEKLNEQLEEQTKLFLSDTTRNTITPDRVTVSKIFSWFGGDFKNGQTLVQFINRYTEVDIQDKAKVKFMDYDWKLNEIK